jgi:hypothetical protein
MKSLWLAVCGRFWTLLLPGLLAFYLPWRYLRLNAVRLAPPSAIQVARRVGRWVPRIPDRGGPA